ncbi:MAG: hypothetical protein ACRCUE_01260 [Bosea sp. (in: a-proteobacteria)]
MRKAQVFLTDDQFSALRRAAKATGRKQSEIIRRGVDLAVAETRHGGMAERNVALDAVFGMWADRDDVEELQTTLRTNAQRRMDDLSS